MPSGSTPSIRIGRRRWRTVISPFRDERRSFHDRPLLSFLTSLSLPSVSPVLSEHSEVVDALRRDGSRYSVSLFSIFPSIRKITEAAPNSYTGSGPCMFPCNDGHASFTPSRAHLKRSVPETSPCHKQARQIDKLDPRRAAFVCRERSRGIETAANSWSASGNASAQLELGSACGQPRQCFVTFESSV